MADKPKTHSGKFQKPNSSTGNLCRDKQHPITKIQMTETQVDFGVGDITKPEKAQIPGLLDQH